MVDAFNDFVRLSGKSILTNPLILRGCVFAFWVVISLTILSIFLMSGCISKEDTKNSSTVYTSDCSECSSKETAILKGIFDVLNNYKNMETVGPSATVSLERGSSTVKVMYYYAPKDLKIWKGGSCTGSMRPNQDCNDYIILYKPYEGDLQVGDIIWFKANSKEYIHRIVKIFQDENGEKTFWTKGDSNWDSFAVITRKDGSIKPIEIYDGWDVHYEDIKYKVIGVIYQ